MGRPLDGKPHIDLKLQNAIRYIARLLILCNVSSFAILYPLGVRCLDGLLNLRRRATARNICRRRCPAKSTLLSSMVLGAQVDVTVVALIGERGREVREFIEDNLGAEGMKRSVLVIATF